MGEENHWGEMGGTLKTTMKMEISPFDRFDVVVPSTVVDVDDESSSRDELNERWRFGLADCGDNIRCLLLSPQNRLEQAYPFGSWDVPRRKLHRLLSLRSVPPS
jgi:hypothetical protein